MNIVKTFSAGGIVTNDKGEVILVNQKVSRLFQKDCAKRVVINKKGEISLTWSFPKGGINKDEDKLVAAIREINEETGISRPELVSALGTIQRDKVAVDETGENFEQKTIHMFHFRTNQEKLKPIDSDNPEARWVKKEEVAKLLTHQKDKEFFLSVIDKI